MIRTYAKRSGEYFNHYGPNDDWKIEQDESSGLWHLYAKEPDAEAWELVERGRTEASLQREQIGRMEMEAFFIKHPETDSHKVV